MIPATAIATERKFLSHSIATGGLLRSLGAEALNLQNPVEATALLAAAQRHGVAPLLHRALLQAEMRLPEPTWQQLSDFVRQNMVRNLQLSRELVRLLRLLKQQGVTAVPYKGPAMAAALWGGLDLRQCADIDLLVRPQNVACAAAAMVEAGYHAAAPMDRAQLERHVRSAAELQFAGADAGSLVELQWRIVPRCFAVELELGDLWPRITAAQLGGESVPALADEDLLLVLCVHGWKHAWARLMWVADVAQLLQTRPLDLGAVWAEAQHRRLRRILLLGMLLAKKEFGAELPAAALEQISRQPEVSKLAEETVARHRAQFGGELRYSEWQGCMLRTRDSWRDRARQMAGFAFTPGLGEQAMLRLPRALAPLYVAVRAGRLSARAARAAWARLRGHKPART